VVAACAGGERKLKSATVRSEAAQEGGQIGIYAGSE
jgi:hypothetical protein